MVGKDEFISNIGKELLLELCHIIRDNYVRKEYVFRVWFKIKCPS